MIEVQEGQQQDATVAALQNLLPAFRTCGGEEDAVRSGTMRASRASSVSSLAVGFILTPLHALIARKAYYDDCYRWNGLSAS